MKGLLCSVGALLCGALVAVACSGGNHNDSGGSGGDNTVRMSPEETGSVCESADECFADVDGLQGDAMCLDRVRDGYCTHTCNADDDCCAADGECDTDFQQVCSPFESTGDMMCFLSCEPEDVRAAGSEDDQDFCQTEASPDFICRSSGGGANNRKVCVPGDCGVGASCATDGDCSGDLTCLTEFSGGYCGVRDCQDNSDCPGDSLCVVRGSGNVCLRPCSTASDCGFCRSADIRADCVDDAEFAEDGTTGSVCVATAK